MCAQIIEATDAFFTNERLWRRLNGMLDFERINLVTAGEVAIINLKIKYSDR